jgi:hypothetical protein
VAGLKWGMFEAFDSMRLEIVTGGLIAKLAKPYWLVLAQNLFFVVLGEY